MWRVAGRRVFVQEARILPDVAKWTHERLGRVFERHGRSLDELAGDDAPDLLAQDQPALAACYGASVADRQLLGDAHFACRSNTLK
ncbi:hypothetical protein DB30_06410 [Enhygromyxa salina]|uniref:Uncharacterized protein n=1 Tax=Enhygromyxa salina TaxID=215803 RepID=A0A0C1ZAL3_9BACT|nr:hypothetical protein DB30_06410 [Enhygromyxa salina]